MSNLKFLRFILLVCTLALLPDVYIWWRYASGFPAPAMAVYAVSSVALALGLCTIFTDRLGWQLTLRLFFGSLLLIALPKAVFALCSVLMPWRAAAVAAGLALMLVGYGFVWGWRRLCVRRETFSFPDLPQAFDGYRILHFSDLHIGSFIGHEDYIRRLVDVINSQECDLIAFTGDMVNLYTTEVEPFVDVLSRLSAPDGVYSILGNHDFGHREGTNADQRLMAIEQTMGWRVLMDEHVRLQRGQESIVLAGVQNAGSKAFFCRGDLKKAVSGTKNGDFIVLLSHTPTHWRREILPTTDIQLTLSGHTHGGQLRLFGLSPAMRIYREWAGRYSERGRWLYVSQGIGGNFPFRMFAWPEITVVELKVAR